MPVGDPLPGEVWTLPNSAGIEGGQAVVLTVEQDLANTVVLHSRTGRRLSVPLRSFLLTWVFEGGEGYSLGSCPACNASPTFPGSVVNDGNGYAVNSCGKCRRLWVLLYPQEDTPEECVGLAEDIQEIVEYFEDQQLVGRIRIGPVAFQMLQKAVGSLGDPPLLAGIPLSLESLPRGPNTVIVVGHQHSDIPRGVQRLGGQPDRTATYTAAQLPPEPSTEKPFTNTQKSRTKPIKRHPLEPEIGTSWWHKSTRQRAHIVAIEKESEELLVRFRSLGSPEILALEDFLTHYQQEPPPPPCKVGEEWVDSSGHTVIICEIEDQAAIVEDTRTRRQYMLHFDHFGRWRKIERKSVYDRLVDDKD